MTTPLRLPASCPNEVVEKLQELADYFRDRHEIPRDVEVVCALPDGFASLWDERV